MTTLQHMKLILLAVLMAGCATGAGAVSSSGGAAQAPAAVAAGEAPIKMNGTAVVGDKTRCAVTGEVFTVKADSEKYEYEGKTYYFCCDGCLDDFKKDPAKFVARIKANPGT